MSSTMIYTRQFVGSHGLNWEQARKQAIREVGRERYSEAARICSRMRKPQDGDRRVRFLAACDHGFLPSKDICAALLGCTKSNVSYLMKHSGRTFDAVENGYSVRPSPDEPEYVPAGLLPPAPPPIQPPLPEPPASQWSLPFSNGTVDIDRLAILVARKIMEGVK